MRPYARSDDHPSRFQAGLQLFVRRLLHHSSLGSAERDALLSLPGTVLTMESETDLLRIGDHSESSYLLLSGVAGSFGQLPDGKRQITGLFIPSDLANLQSLVHPRVGWPIHVLTASAVATIPNVALRRLARRFSGIGEVL